MSSTPPQAGNGAHTAQLLVTSRVGDPMQPPTGFDEVYWCTECNDYFVLACQDAGSAVPSRCQRVPPHKKVSGNVFCPRCSEGFADYGPILPFAGP